jgi:tetratricopeptide (TPR) repeat protein
MFVTFYSYKGGVGRTLALVNVAHLLATDREEPCRVLIWDFDLEAPGVTHLIPPKWGERKLGFVDLVDRYCTQVQIPPVEEYIHSSEIAGIDILPAGLVDEQYSSKLERINWQVLYEKKRGFDFLEQIKTSIENLEQRYDYVLIDARTGYSDVGGICLQQLPNLVVLMFRLNGQNLEGTSKTYDALQEFAKRTQKRLDVIPVISPAWPFASFEANSFVKRARTIFKTLRPLEISFDSSLTFGEKIIVRDRQKYEIRPRTIEDYDRLARRIRQNNLTDPLTMIQISEEKQTEERHDEAFKIRCTLVDRRPKNWKYWSLWLQSANTLSSPETALAFIDAHTARDSHLANAYVALARLRWIKAKDRIDPLTKAIQEEPSLPLSYLDRGRAFSELGRYREALNDFDKSLSLSSTPTGLIYRGLCCLSLRDFEGADRDFRAVLEQNPKDVHTHVNLALTMLITGRHSDAKLECEKALDLDPTNQGVKLMLAHVLARVGERERAKGILQELSSTALFAEGDILNLAEGLVSIEEPQQALQWLNRMPKSRKAKPKYKVVADLLRYFCNLMQGIVDVDLEKKVQSVPRTKPKLIRESTWRYLELKSFLLYAGEESKLSPEIRKRLLELVESYESIKQQTPDPQ